MSFFANLGIVGPDPKVIITIYGNEKLNKYRDEVLGLSKPIYKKDDVLDFNVHIVPPPGEAIHHKGIYFSVACDYVRSNGDRISTIIAKRVELVPPGCLKSEIKQRLTYDTLKLSVPTYVGKYINVTWSAQLSVVHTLKDFNVTEEFIVVHFVDPPKELTPSRHLIGIGNVLHIELVFPSVLSDIRSPLIGAVYFVLIDLRIVYMSITFHKSEKYSDGDIHVGETYLVKEFEIMDGAPVKGDYIPIRLFLGELNIWPFIQGQALKVSNYAKLCLKDEHGKCYYKQIKVDFNRIKPPELIVVDGN